MQRFLLYLAASLLVLGTSTYSQYFSETVLYKKFEPSKYFFSPNFLNTFAVDGFEQVSIGLMNERFNNLILNPTNIVNDDDVLNNVFVDFRNTIESEQQQVYAIPLYWYERGYEDVRIAMPEIALPYPRFISQPRREPDPILSLGILTKPLPTTVPRFYFGLTYQAIYTNEQYYPVLQDIYYPIFGYDFLGVRAEGLERYPIIDRQFGTNEMRHRAHFLSNYLGYRLSDNMDIGVKINRSFYDRNGEQGTANLWQPRTSNTQVSGWQWQEERTQHYNHWDIAVGANYHLNQKSTLGITGGLLPATATQDFNRFDTSYYASTSTTTSLYSSRRYSTSVQHWEEKGNLFYVGANYTTEIKEHQRLFFRYYYQAGRPDISLSSNILDTSFYRSQWQYDTTVYRSYSDNKVVDNRGGDGTASMFLHQLYAMMFWDINETFSLNYGFFFSHEQKTTETSEDIFSERSAAHFSSWYSPSSSFYRVREEKTLVWKLDWQQTTIQIPFYLRWKPSRSFHLLAGINRLIIDRRIEDVTTAYFHYHEQTIDTVRTRKEQFAERYKPPTEHISEVSTPHFIGVEIFPSEYITLRVLLRPDFFDESRYTQVWLSFQLLP